MTTNGDCEDVAEDVGFGLGLKCHGCHGGLAVGDVEPMVRPAGRTSSNGSSWNVLAWEMLPNMSGIYRCGGLVCPT